MSTVAKDYIIGVLTKTAPLPPGVDIDAYRYLDNGHIDSMALIKFIFNIEEEFKIRLSPDDTQSDEFRTVGGLAALIEKKRQG